MSTSTVPRSLARNCRAFSSTKDYGYINLLVRKTPDTEWSVEYISFLKFTAEAEADALAKMLIYLLENRLIPGALLDGKCEAIPRPVRRRGVRAARLAPNA
jgi:hypothetical protein